MIRTLASFKAFKVFIILIVAFVVACGGKSPLASLQGAPATRPAPTRTPFQPLPPTPIPACTGDACDTPIPACTGDACNTPTPAATSEASIAPTATLTPPGGLTLWVDPSLPERLRLGFQFPAGVVPVPQIEQAALRLAPGGGVPVSQWVYALVAPFPTVEDGVSSGDLRSLWSGESTGKPLLMDSSTLAVFSAVWGSPAAGAVETLPPDQLLGYAWDHPSTRAILPFEALEPRWKVLEVDGLSPLRKGFDPAAYALTAPIALQGDPALVEPLLALNPGAIPASNRDPGKLTVLVMTGVTALVRATAYTMEQRGIKYPAKDIGDWLREADITHISNEVPFADKCPFPDPVQQGMRFCSDSRYIGLLEEVGTDIVELTGDHFADWGEEAMRYTLDLYKERGWLYYGGGEDLQDGRKPVTIEHNGNRLAFIGCNGKGGPYAQAGKNHPGAVTCDFDYMQGEIARLLSEGYLPIATFQHFEYYNYRAQPDQERDFRRLAQAGAVVVSGSQAHQPQAFEFDQDALIHYGLGNLFFDQLDVSPATRQAFIDRHIFYNGRYIGTELLTIMFVDYARPRPMTPGEREDLLRTVFNASGW